MRRLDYGSLEMWLNMGDRILDDNYSKNLTELARALYGFQVLKPHSEHIDFDRLIFELEKSCFEEMKYCDLKGFAVLAQCLENLKNNSDILFDTMEELVMNQLEPNYTSKDLALVVRNMAISRRCSLEFYEQDRMPVKDADLHFTITVLGAYSEAMEYQPELKLSDEF
eukprot:CAMPEP_0114581176 /NCGR_PEP_ID=MMETSP0125-20121206/5320_1 /TAXON_ID=485358 ORGANISM="Aristerostoma sp., Strain ATCC 50986" /NCGR_SAMPLE_ID=MMETSP0125 /ASSEMBLY_ACC=CAM_ASM_000245 /LENGTH=167 /DNA_ID=CAMNT_0001773193 /DNA_START=456 /DNA_END=960 /DNA_ORIENTATION=+